MQLQIDKLGKVAVTIEKDYWNINKDYDKLTIVEVKDKFATYISRIPTPAGTELNNRKYWIPFSSLKEEIVIHYNEWVNLYGGLLSSQAEVLNNIQKIINDIYTHLPNGIIFEGDIDVCDVDEPTTIHLTCTTTGNKPASEIKLYKNNTLIKIWHNATHVEIDAEVDSDTEFRLEAVIDGWKYYGSWNVAVVYPFYIGTDVSVENVIENEDYKHKGSEGLNGIYHIAPNDDDYIFVVAPKWVAIPEITMGGIRIPFEDATEYIIDEIVYYVYKSINQYQQGRYSIKIGSVEYDKDSLVAELLNNVTDMSDEFAEFDDRITEVERIAGNRDKSTVVPVHMGRVTLKPNVKYPINKGWGIYTYNFNYDGDYSIDTLVYFEDDKFYLPYRNVRHPKVINVISQTSFTEQKLDVGDADVNDIAEALNITEESQYLFYDDDDFVVNMPNGSQLSIADVINSNWPLHDYTDFLNTKNLLTQSMITEANTIYIIQDDFTLDNKTITVPENCVLKFEGGSLSNGALVFNDTFLDGTIDIRTLIEGTIKNSDINVLWFGISNKGEIDNTERIREILSLIPQQYESEKNICSLYFPQGVYLLNMSIISLRNDILQEELHICGDGSAKTILKAADSSLPVITLQSSNVHIQGISCTEGDSGILIDGSAVSSIFITDLCCKYNNYGLSLRKCVELVIDKSYFWYNKLYGFYSTIARTYTVTSIKNSSFRWNGTDPYYNNGVGALFSGFRTLIVENCYFEANGKYGTQIVGDSLIGNLAEFINCWWEKNNIKGGIDTLSSSINIEGRSGDVIEGVTFRNCFIPLANNSYAVTLIRAKNITFENCAVGVTAVVDYTEGEIYDKFVAVKDINNNVYLSLVTENNFPLGTTGKWTIIEYNSDKKIYIAPLENLILKDSLSSYAYYKNCLYLCRDLYLKYKNDYIIGNYEGNHYDNTNSFTSDSSYFVVEGNDTTYTVPLVKTRNNYILVRHSENTNLTVIFPKADSYPDGIKFTIVKALDFQGKILFSKTGNDRIDSADTIPYNSLNNLNDSVTFMLRKYVLNTVSEIHKWSIVDYNISPAKYGIVKPETGVEVGFSFFDKSASLPIPIYFKETGIWVNSDGIDLTNVTSHSGSSFVMHTMEATLTAANNGLRFFNTDLNKWYTFNGANGHMRFEDEHGYYPGEHKGGTAARTALTASLGDYDEGYDFYDTDANMIYYFGFDNDTKVWRDAAGNIEH